MNITKITAKLRQSLASPRARFYAFCSFVALVFLTGGSSRDDIQSLVILRPLSVLFAAYALSVADYSSWKGRLFPVYLILALVALMILQLVPLPPSVWAQFPGRKIFADIADLAGMAQPWRPLTLSPSRTVNSLMSLFVPLASVFLYLNLPTHMRKRAIIVIIIMISLSVLLAIAQITGPARSSLYLYRITNYGSAVGFFANRNHQAVLLAMLILLLGWYAGSTNKSKESASFKIFAAFGGVVAVIPLVLVTGSRAGLILSVAAIPIAFWLFSSPDNVTKTVRTHPRSGRFVSRRNLTIVLSVTGILAVASMSLLFSRSLALDRLFADGDITELRSELLPILISMAREYFPFGIGFGAFQHVYPIHEPLDLLAPAYLNRAHNDWLEFVIEAGLPGLFILVFAIGWISRRTIIILRDWKTLSNDRYVAILSLCSLLFVAAGSVGDYPARVPSIMLVCAIMLAIFADCSRKAPAPDPD
ncbi:O-antigen ligase family protein [Sphingorhabdus arenilitoris]|uniref:O-antigen ligase family protein n=1 Tax=Sphingorhabdus arenilitoris TaxID=1490041 RepID=A0ABV8RHY6_9SPHN